VSANPRAPVIRGVDAQWAREVVDHCVATLLIQAERHLANNETERCAKRILEVVRAAGNGGIRQRDLTRKLQFIEPRLRREFIADLVESEQLIAVNSGVSGRPATTYRIASAP
jgi:hypothetical protein